MNGLEELKEGELSEADRAALDHAVLWKLDRWLLPLTTILFMLSVVVRIWS